MIDFAKLSMLIGPMFRQRKSERDNRERLARANMKRAKGPKKHSTNKERSFIDRRNAAHAKRAVADHVAELQGYREQVRAYWSGNREEHP